MLEFEGRIAVVTGGALGIGQAVVSELAARGAHVVALDINAAALQKSVAEWQGAGRSVEALTVDVSDAASVDAAFATIAERHGVVHQLVNVAGIVRYGRVDEFSEADWDLVMNTNVKSMYLTTRRAIPLMRNAGGGSIVNFASVQAIASEKTVAAYSASKGAVISMTRTMALDHAPDGIRVNCILPGSVETPMLRHSAAMHNPDDPDAAMQDWGAMHPLGFLAQPADMASVVAFLLGDGARVITGAPIIADEGLLAKLGV